MELHAVGQARISNYFHQKRRHYHLGQYRRTMAHGSHLYYVMYKNKSIIISILCISFNLILGVGGLIGNIFFGFVTTRFGRKWPLLFLAIPTIVWNSFKLPEKNLKMIGCIFEFKFQISWLLILFAQNANHLILSRIINGTVGGGLFAIAPIFFSEIAKDR